MIEDNAFELAVRTPSSQPPIVFLQFTWKDAANGSRHGIGMHLSPTFAYWQESKDR